jgi:hypothetical protein
MNIPAILNAARNRLAVEHRRELPGKTGLLSSRASLFPLKYPRQKAISALLVVPHQSECGGPEQAMADYSYILNKTPVQLRLLGARGGRTYGRNQRARRALMRAQPPPVPQRAAPGESTAQAMAALDAQFPWLRCAER